MAVASSARARRTPSARIRRRRASYCISATSAGAGIVVLKVFKTFSVNSPLTFTVIERPKPAMVRVLNRAGDDAELLHLTDTRAAAEAWLASHRYSDAVLDEVTADESTSDTAEGRAA